MKRNKTISQSKGMFNIDSRLFRTRQSVQVGKDLKDNPERIDRKSKIITIVERGRHAQSVGALKQKDLSVDFRRSTPSWRHANLYVN